MVQRKMEDRLNANPKGSGRTRDTPAQGTTYRTLSCPPQATAVRTAWWAAFLRSRTTAKTLYTLAGLTATIPRSRIMNVSRR